MRSIQQTIESNRVMEIAFILLEHHLEKEGRIPDDREQEGISETACSFAKKLSDAMKRHNILEPAANSIQLPLVEGGKWERFKVHSPFDSSTETQPEKPK